MSSTHEAFSLPTSSPGFHPHPDAFDPETLQSPPSGQPSYSYPPQSAGVYDFVPTTTGSRSRPSSLLPLHSSSLPPLPSYPPLSQTWERLRKWLSREYPELGDTLNYGILPQDLAQVEMSLGFALPAAIRESYLCVDGQEAESSAGCSEGLFFGLTLLPLEDVLEEWRFWREVDDDPQTGANSQLRELMQSIPAGWVKKEYSSRGWIPLVTDKAGNYLGVDMTPGEGGAVGQIIVFGRDFDTKVVMWRGDGEGGWAKWLASFVEELESGEGFELGSTNDSDGSEDSVGYESYFFDGVGGGQGDTGGDSGTGGLRLNGEYKGWSVLEAWADRSVRRWQEAGLYTDEIYLPSEKGKEKVSLDRLQIATSGNGSGAEVPIPVLSEEGEETSALATTPLGNVTNKSYSNARPALPTISVTKPPAPLPVDLPTPELIDPLSSHFRAPPEGDLEAGDNMAMREIDLKQPHMYTVRQEVPSSSNTRDEPITSRSTASNVVSPPLRTLTDSPETISPAGGVATAAHIPDLLASDPTTPTAYVNPSLPLDSISVEKAIVVDLAAKPEDDSPVLIDADEANSQVPDVPIRLVGGGGLSGTIEEQNDVVIVDEPDSVDAVTTSPNDSVSTTMGRHEKKKSISSSLKSFGQLGGGKRKKDSVSLKGSG
ncbi:hypothetical protein AcW1_005839 [Taiwanofungus camphoratus]|nr:hypothetical protein AcV7_008915 [Antrodia cinnamomea]KAI0957452.1 hypothetical protein AcW1_005839 [Antrodia cinnamomea]